MNEFCHFSFSSLAISFKRYVKYALVSSLFSPHTSRRHYVIFKVLCFWRLYDVEDKREDSVCRNRGRFSQAFVSSGMQTISF